MKCKLCKVSVINGIGYQDYRNNFICSKCMADIHGITIKDGKYLVDIKYFKDFIENKEYFV